MPPKMKQTLFYRRKKEMLASLEQIAGDLLRLEQQAACPDEEDLDLFSSWGAAADSLFHAVSTSLKDAEYAELASSVRSELESAAYGAMMRLADEGDLTHDQATIRVQEMLKKAL